MNETLIKELIQFAVDNGYKNKNIDYIGYIDGTNLGYGDMASSEINGNFVEIFNVSEGFKSLFESITDLLLSMPFIEALARGILKHEKESIRRLESTRDSITTKLAFGIRDNTLDQVIKDILPNK